MVALDHHASAIVLLVQQLIGLFLTLTGHGVDLLLGAMRRRASLPLLT
jgi:hypothetical protein